MNTSFSSVHIIPKLNSENDPDVLSAIRTVHEVAEDVGIGVVDRQHITVGTLIIAIGGDGTMLEAMRTAAVHGATALGINLGRVGFLSDLNVKDPKYAMYGDVLFDILMDFRRTSTFIEVRSVLVTSLSTTAISCNEVSVSPLYSDTMITYHLKVDQFSAGIHRANSLLISTATGSTAYSLSAGGSLMMPDLDALQIVPVAPITMTSRPIIVAGDSQITVEVTSNSISVRGDGQQIFQSTEKFTKDAPFKLTIKKHVRPAKVLHLASWNYFDALSEKLGWIKE